MHDSRGAQLKIGDRVFIEAEVTELQNGDENYCCCAVKVVVPDQPTKDEVMQPPTFSAMSTKMLTKIASLLAIACLLVFVTAAPAEWKRGPLPPNTWNWGAIVAYTSGQQTNGYFYFADFHGDHAIIFPGNKKVEGYLILWYDNSIELPPNAKPGKDKTKTTVDPAAPVIEAPPAVVTVTTATTSTSVSARGRFRDRTHHPVRNVIDRIRGR